MISADWGGDLVQYSYCFHSFFIQLLLFYSFLFLSSPTRVVEWANWTLLVLLLLFISVRFSLVQLSRRQLWGLSVCFFAHSISVPFNRSLLPLLLHFILNPSLVQFDLCVSASLRTGLLLINCCFHRRCCHCCCYTVYLSSLINMDTHCHWWR